MATAAMSVGAFDSQTGARVRVVGIATVTGQGGSGIRTPIRA